MVEIFSCSQVILNQLFNICLIWISYVDDINDEWGWKERLNMWYSIAYSLRSIELAVNSVILCCNFEANRNIYQCVCGCCDRCAHKRCVQKTLDKIMEEL